MRRTTTAPATQRLAIAAFHFRCGRFQCGPHIQPITLAPAAEAAQSAAWRFHFEFEARQ
jgi:hypothetical protein